MKNSAPVASTTLAGAMILQTREMLAGKDPRDMTGDRGDKPRDLLKFWAKAMLQGGSLGIYGDFLQAATATGASLRLVRDVSGPTIGPLLDLGLVNPIGEVWKALGEKETNFWAKEFRTAKTFFPGANIWYAKAAMDHLVWNQIMEALSPGYLNNIRRRTMKEGQSWWWEPDDLSPERAPDFGAALGK